MHLHFHGERFQHSSDAASLGTAVRRAGERQAFHDVGHLGGLPRGGAQRRLRWFALARRESGKSSRRSEWQRGELPAAPTASGIHFNGGRPPAEQWLLAREEHAAVSERLDVSGNAVVPLQAYFAAIALGL